MNNNAVLEIVLVVLVVVGYFVTGNYFKKRANNSTGWAKWIFMKNSITLIVSGIILVGIFIYILLIRLK